MIELMKVKDNYAIPNPELRSIPAFRDLIARDRGSEGDSQGRKKLQASKELAWIYFVYDPLSPYQSLEMEEKLLKVGEVVFGDPKFKPDDTIAEAAKRYEEMVTTLPVRLLQSAREGCYTIINYLKAVDLTAEDEKGKPKHKVGDVIRALERMGEITDSLEKLEERVKKQRDKEVEVRGGYKINKYNSGE